MKYATIVSIKEWSYSMLCMLLSLTIFLVLITENANGQRKINFAKVAFAGIQYSDFDFHAKSRPFAFREQALVLHAAISMTKHWNFGIKGARFWYKTRNPRSDLYTLRGIFYMVGVYSQLSLYLEGIGSRAFLEFGLNRSNYCACGTSYYYKRDGLLYLSYGFGMNWKLYKGLSIEFVFLFIPVISKMEEVSDLNAPRFGLTYHFGEFD